MAYYFFKVCKELVVFRVCSNSSNYIHNFLSLFWGCSVTWLITQRSGSGKNAAIGVQNSFFAYAKNLGKTGMLGNLGFPAPHKVVLLRKIIKAVKVPAAPYRFNAACCIFSLNQF